MCVCVFGIIVLNIFVERWFWELKILIGSLVKLHAWLHSYLCFSLLEKRVLSYLDTSLIPAQHLAIYRASKLFLIAISIDPRQLGGLIEKVPGPLIASRYLVDWSSFCSCVFTLFLDTSSTASSADVVFLDTFLKRWLDTSIYRELLKLYILVCRDPVLISSICLHLFTSQITLSHSKPLSQVFFKLFQFFFTW